MKYIKTKVIIITLMVSSPDHVIGLRKNRCSLGPKSSRLSSESRQSSRLSKVHFSKDETAVFLRRKWNRKQLVIHFHNSYQEIFLQLFNVFISPQKSPIKFGKWFLIEFMKCNLPSKVFNLFQAWFSNTEARDVGFISTYKGR